MKKLFLVGIIFLNLLLISNLHAFEYWSSTFDNDTEGWQVYLYPEDDFDGPLYNDDGYICYTRDDPDGGNWLFVKLDWYDWTEVYGGTISFDIKVSGDGNSNNAGATVILDLPGDIGTFFYADIHITPTEEWVTYTVPILDEVFTRFGGSNDKLSENLEDIRGIDIRGNLLIGEETTCIDNVKIYPPVNIDVKPGSFPNCFNMNGHGVIPVAILGSVYFDVMNINLETLSFNGLNVQVRGKKEKTMCHYEDVSGDFTYLEGAPDEYLDLVCQFEDDPEQWVNGYDEAKVTGELLDGTPFEGTDAICIVP
jgi:hypothetical protein